ncbi:MAG: hypothetical protein IT373_31790 [Polyangiaceae bacterium]|nr:hypothetical protein [Polyangiaceae bacterium]
MSTRTARALSLHGALAACVLAGPMSARAGEPDAATASSLLATGRADAALGLVRSAAVSCRRALRLANEVADESLAREAFACIEDAERRVAHVVVRGAPPDTTLSLYGGPPEPVVERLALDPGTVVVTVTVPDGALEPAVLELRDGEERVLDVATLARVPDEPRPPRPPVAWSARSTSLPSGTVAFGAWFFFGLLLPQKPKPSGPIPPAKDELAFLKSVGVGWGVGARGAVSDDVALEAVETFNVGYVPGDLLLGLDARLVPGDFELGLGVTGRVPIVPGAGGGYLALRGSGRAGGVLRVDGSLGVGAVKAVEGSRGWVGLFQPTVVAMGMGEAIAVAPGLALAATLTPVDTFYFGLDSGFGMQSFVVPSSMFLPLGFRLGGTIPFHDAPVVDIDFRWTFPYWLMPVRGDERWLPAHSERNIVADCFWTTLGFQAYLFP